MRLRISARKSDLARLQAYQVGNSLVEKNPELKLEYNFRESLGDKNLTDPLWKMPEKGVFTEDFVQDLLDEKTDLVVHSWKDLPTAFRGDTKIVATLPRADQRDLLVFKKSSTVRVEQTKSLNVFSSSPRRAYNLVPFLKDHMPFDLKTVEFKNVRGNIQTRVRKLLEDPAVDALILAKAAMDRLLLTQAPEFAETKNFLRQALQELNWMVLPLSVNPNAAAQGALAIEIKTSRKDLEPLLATIHSEETFRCAQQERDILASYGGGCHQKIGISVLARNYGQVFFLRGLTDGGQVLQERSVTAKASTSLPKKGPSDPFSVPVEKFAPHELASSKEIKITRTPLTNIAWPEKVEALWISKAESMPDGGLAMKPLAQFKGPIWTAGLTTWKKLAERKFWVHGSAEGLGESEEPQIDALLGAKPRWTKLSHAQAEEILASKDGTSASTGRGAQTVATYEIAVDVSEWQMGGREYFFWHSGSQFLAALRKEPELKAKRHACGPGSTYQVLRSELGPDALIQIFFNEEQWRAECSL